MSECNDKQGAALLTPLLEIGKRWQEVNPARAMGGIWAASGFQYQFDVLLSRVCDAFGREHETSRLPTSAGPVFSEILSDVLESDVKGGCAYVVQVKHTVRAAQLRAAFEEFLSVAHFINVEAPDWLPLLRFQVATQSCEVADTTSLVDSWMRKITGFPEPIRQALSGISVLEVPDPVDEIVTFLINRLFCAQPYDTLSELRGMIIGKAADPVSGLHDVWQQLTAIARNAEPSGVVHWVSDDDRPPKAVKLGAVLVGENPHFPHLRAGCFALRPQYEILTSRFLDFIGKEAGEEAKQPLFWIGGRSGAGKSVALLHLLAHVKQTQNMDILYLRGQSGLPEALRMALKGTKGGRRVIIGVDDPFAPGETGLQRWEQALRVTSSLQERSDSPNYPILVCCGPAEQRLRLEAAFMELVTIGGWDVPNATVEDVEGLRTWYLARTGRLAPEIDGENLLLVQLFFEWRTGKRIPEFASRLRRRLEALKPKAFYVVARALSANRLYLDYPTRALQDLRLTPQERDSLNILLREHHMEPSFAEGEHVRIAHPHLANAVYETWFPSDGTAEETRADHVSRLLSAYVEPAGEPGGQTAPIWGLCHSLRSSAASTVRSRLTEADIHAPLCAAYKATAMPVKSGPDLIPLLPAWIELSSLLQQLPLAPPPASLAMALLRDAAVPCRGTRLVCHKLMEFMSTLGLPTEVKETVVSVLRRFPDWHEWPYVAVDLLQRLPEDGEVLKLCSDWLGVQTHATRGMAQLLTELIAVRPGDRRVLALAVGSPCMRSPYEGRVVAAACRNSAPAAGEMFESWLRDHSREAQAARTLGQGILGGLPGAIQAGTKWCERWHAEDNATWVLEPLLDLGPDPDLCRKWALIWLSTHGGPAASYVVERLLRQHPGSREVLDAAHRWLEAESPELPHWLPVWLTTSRQETRALSALISLGMEGLRDAPITTRHWAPAWRQLWRIAHGDPSLLDLAVEKLSQAQALQSNRTWLRAWLTVFRESSAERRITDLGIQWLNARLTTRRWAMTWTAIADVRREDDVVIDCAIRWLAHNTGTWRVWAAIWLRCHEMAKQKSHELRLVAAAREWLPKVPWTEIPAWTTIWQKTAKGGDTTEGIADVAHDWLVDDDHWGVGDWDKIWSILWHAESHSDLRDMGLVWLREGVAEFSTWPTVWGQIWQGEKDGELPCLAIRWLKQRHRYKHGSWVRVLRDLVNAGAFTDDLADIGIAWLKSAPSRSNWWADVWTTTARPFDPLPRELVHLGNRWLDQSQPSSNAWGKVASRLLSNKTLHASVAKHLRRFLDEQPTANQWGSLWRIYCSMPEAVEPMALGRRWLTMVLKRNPSNTTWHMVWQDMIERENGTPATELCDLGKQWLAVVPAKITAWPNVWIRLWEMDPSIELRELGQGWIEKGYDRNPTYERVVIALRGLPIGREGKPHKTNTTE
ncbi:MAG: hypothetical protein PHP44_03165 [Kiritimatiellae bacterium]|nr:hypothetical protein [Kiritimatiellia bacterium]